MANDKMQEFANIFKVITGVSMDRAIDMELAGKHCELLVEIDENIHKEMSPESYKPDVYEAARARAREADIGGNLPVNFMDKIK